MPVALDVTTEVPLTAYPGQLATPLLVVLVDHYQRHAWTSLVPLELLEVSVSTSQPSGTVVPDALDTIGLVSGANLQFGSRSQVLLDALRVSSSPNSTLAIDVKLSPNTLGVPTVVKHIIMQPCAPGDGPSGLACEECSVGSASSAGVCEQCRPGYFNDDRGAERCVACPLNHYSAAVGAASIATCVKCPANTITARSGTTAATDCIPAPGFFRDDTGISRCPVWSNCTVGALSAEELWLKPGFWRPVNWTTHALPCNIAERCIGGAMVAGDASLLCQSGSTGPLCAVCKDGHYLASNTCEVCPDATLGHVASAFISVIIMFGVLLSIIWGCLFLRHRRKRRIRNALREERRRQEALDDHHSALAQAKLEAAVLRSDKAGSRRANDDKSTHTTGAGVGGTSAGAQAASSTLAGGKASKTMVAGHGNAGTGHAGDAPTPFGRGSTTAPAVHHTVYDETAGTLRLHRSVASLHVTCDVSSVQRRSRPSRML